MSNAVAKVEPTNTPAVISDVRKMEKQFALALPEHVSPEKFVRVVITAIQSNPDLKNADRLSVLGAALKCAQDGLLPDGKEAALVTYGNKAQYLPMIAGVLTKVRRSGELRTINAHVVYEKDTFTYTLGDEEKIEHQPYLEGARGKPIAAYAIAKTKDGGIYREVMSIDQIEKVRNVSRAKSNGPWVQWWDEMARKTVLRRLSKRLPMSTDLQQVFQRDDDHYDLTQAQGAAKLRRLHADFDEPAPPLAAELPDSPPAADDDFPGDKTASPADAAPSDPPKGGAAGGEKLTLAQRTDAFLKSVKDAASTAQLRQIGRDAEELQTDLDRHDPDRLTEVQAAFDARMVDLETVESEERRGQ